MFGDKMISLARVGRANLMITLFVNCVGLIGRHQMPLINTFSFDMNLQTQCERTLSNIIRIISLHSRHFAFARCKAGGNYTDFNLQKMSQD